MDKSTKPATLTIQKMGPGLLPEPVSRLWRERNAFSIIEDTIYYYENGEQVTEKINFLGREVSAKLHRNGRLFGNYRTAGGYPVGTIELYNGDLVVFENVGKFSLHYSTVPESTQALWVNQITAAHY
ncbi:hypothetical protein SAMN05661091_2955 [Paenibacillus uliginis N3/975]|uniref:Uncharacterized protein n=1 Tax=Paenibacillus uliginis N3/975 TaxID=1313296 RepID=A0A1X7HFU3_9BACL|nr:hypothetical protein [Paenibacillus uliginis]SMF85303.1 hypothetical protein SAMN05661091_2955 [Paenibacillus uliginis N3/975]